MELENKLQEIMDKNPELEMIILVASDGLPISFKTKMDNDVEETSAKAMALFNNASSIGFSDPEKILLLTKEKKYLYIKSIQEDIFLIAIFASNLPGKTLFYLDLFSSEISI